MLKLLENPPMLPLNKPSPAQLGGRWWVAHTKARFEKAFAWDLLSAGVGYFLPLLERIRFSGGRRRQVLLPMFTSYVFVCCHDEQRHLALQTNRLCQLIPVRDQAKLVAELSSVHKALAGDQSLDFYPDAAVGSRCRFVDGPLLGVEGVVVERERMAKVVLQITVLGQGVALQVHPDILEAVA